MNSERKRGIIERVGSALPESNILFLILTAIIIIASFFAQGNHTSALKGGGEYTVRNVLSVTGFQWILANILENFRRFPALPLVVVGVLGFGFAEKTGLLGTLIKVVGQSTSEKLILPVLVFIGINSSIASDAGYIVLVPLGGALYAGLGRNPLVGVTATFAAVSAGFGAAMIPTPGDGLLGGITREIYENTFGSTFPFNIMTMNYWFMFASTIMLTALISLVGKFFVEKRVTAYGYTLPENISNVEPLGADERRALRNAGLAFLATFAVLVGAYFIGILKPYVDASGRTINPILSNIIVLLILLFLFPSLAYAKTLKIINNGKEYINLTVKAMRDISYILVFSVFAGNFLAVFNYSGLDKYIANNGAAFLIGLHIQNPVLLIISFVFISAFINLFMGGASSKWAILAPIFVPLLMIVSNNELTPDVIQVAYRIGDSATNVITPLMTYMGVMLIAARHYNEKFELGDLIAVMMPYSISILIGWTTFFMIWLALRLPFGF